MIGRRTFLRRAALAYAAGATSCIADGWTIVAPANAAPPDDGQNAHRDAPSRDGTSRDRVSGLLDDNAASAIRQGLAFLAARQQENGSFGAKGYRGNVGVCGLAAMAMMSTGSSPERGPYGRHVGRFLSYILGATQQSGFISVVGAGSHGPMYDHGFATLLLAECYGMSPRPDLREKLAAAAKLIVDAQNDQGGWRYQPQRDEADVSVTVCQVMALRAARNAGIFVPGETIERATEYVKQCQNADGGFMYIKGGGESSFPRSAAAVVALYSAGIYDGPELAKGLDYLAGFAPGDGVVTRHNHYFYAHYYAVQAMWHAGGKHWRAWYPAVRDEIVSRQNKDGSWLDPIGHEYGTAMACLILQMPATYLPIFQR